MLQVKFQSMCKGTNSLKSSSALKTIQGTAGVAGIVVNEVIKKQEENLKQEAFYKDSVVLDNMRNKYILNGNDVNDVDNTVKAYVKEANEYLVNDSELSKLYNPVDTKSDIGTGVKNFISNIAQKAVDIVKKQV